MITSIEMHLPKIRPGRELVIWNLLLNESILTSLGFLFLNEN